MRQRASVRLGYQTAPKMEAHEERNGPGEMNQAARTSGGVRDKGTLSTLDSTVRNKGAAKGTFGPLGSTISNKGTVSTLHMCPLSPAAWALAPKYSVPHFVAWQYRGILLPASKHPSAQHCCGLESTHGGTYLT